MVFNKSALFLLVLLFPIIGLAQLKIVGKLVDYKGNPVESAEVILLNRDSVAIKSQLSNKEGFLNIDINKGNYLLQIRQLGSVLYNRNLSVEADIDIGTVKVESVQQLHEVAINFKRKLIERKEDRLIFNVAHSINAIGGDGLDVLKITPGIRVKEEAINIIGKNSMSVMVDNRLVPLSGQDLMNFLRNIKADQIKRIEVITNPPAKYDAEGNSGIVNIELKKLGLDSWNALLNSSYKKSTYSTMSNGLSFSYKKHKLSFYTNFNYVEGSKKGVEDENILYANENWNTEYNRRIYTNVLSGNLGFDYHVTPTWTIGLQYLGSLSKPVIQENDYSIINNNETLKIDSLVTSKSRDHKNIRSNSINMHSLIKLDSLGKNISIDLDYFKYNNDINRSSETQNSFLNSLPTPFGYVAVKNSGFQALDIYTLKIDVGYPLKWINLSYGAKINFSKTNYDNKYFDIKSGIPVLRNNQSNKFKYLENTQAFYISGNKKLSDSWDIKIGLRLENTQTEGNSLTNQEITKRKYIEFFPTAYVQYTASEQNSFSLNYGRRLSRPRYNQLNPFKVFYNPYSYTQGNPLLLPAFTNNVEFQHAYKDFLFTSLSFSNTTNGNASTPFFDEKTKVQYLLDLNYYTSNSFNLATTYVFNKLKWWESENQLNVFYVKTKVTKDINIKGTKGFGAYLSTNNSFILNKRRTLKAELNYWFQAPQYQDIYKTQSVSSLDIGVKYALFNNALQLGLVVEDIFRRDIDIAKTFSNNIQYNYADYNDNRFCRISISYKFGSQKIDLGSRKFGNEEEKKRAN